MYKLIYDVISNDYSIYGIEETFNTWIEAHNRMNELKNCSDDYMYFIINEVG
jgi:hypothetical protein